MSTSFISGIDAAVRARAQRLPDELAAVDPLVSLSWGELDRAADRVAGLLAAAGVGPGSRVGWLSRNRVGYAAYLLGIWRRRATIVALNWRMPPGAVRAAAQAVAVSHLVVASEFAEALTDLVPAGTWSTIHDESRPPAPDCEPVQALPPRADDEALVYFTSGSTGAAKAVPLTRAAVEITQRYAVYHDLVEGSRSLTIPPLFHAAGATWLNYGLTRGVTQYFTDDTTAAAMATILAREQITHTILVPTLIHGLIKHLEEHPQPFPALKHVGYGTSPIPLPVLRKAITILGCDFCQVYGMTELGGGLAFLVPSDHRDVSEENRRLASAGRLGEGMEVSVRDPMTGAELPVGAAGELWFRAPCMTHGYLGLPEETARLIVDGWLNSRDAGYLDADGYLFVQGRTDDMIQSGGENVYPAEVENVLMRIPAVLECAVVGLPDERWGERVAAVVVAEREVDAAELQAYCRRFLPGFKVPGRIKFVDALPRNATGKVIRADLTDW